MPEEATLTTQETDGLRAAVAKVLAESDEGRTVQVLSALVMVCSVALLAAEKDARGEIRTYGDALWNATNYVISVGESGCPPVTPGGRLVATILMVVGCPLYDRVKGRIGGLLAAGIGGAATGRRSAFETELMGKLDRVLERI